MCFKIYIFYFKYILYIYIYIYIYIMWYVYVCMYVWPAGPTFITLSGPPHPALHHWKQPLFQPESAWKHRPVNWQQHTIMNMNHKSGHINNKIMINIFNIYFISPFLLSWLVAGAAWRFRDMSRDAKGLGTSSKLRCYVGLRIVTLLKNLIKYENRFSQIFNIGYRELHATYMDFYLFCF